MSKFTVLKECLVEKKIMHPGETFELDAKHPTVAAFIHFEQIEMIPEPPPVEEEEEEVTAPKK